MAAEPADHRLQEWSESRATLGRMDGIVADLRKYGFTLVTVLLTATALITPADPVTDRVASSAVVMALILVLFLMDRYWWGLLREAAARASELEKELGGIVITQRLGAVATRISNTKAASAVYAVFVLVAFFVALPTVVSHGRPAGLAILLGLTCLALIAIVALHCWFEKQIPPEPT
ncbi:MAG: hypothetical protein JOZ75_11390 [Candidatus Dormibacteraeota bacterium]|nr:hypothetical protein [Candidatus Dormibacteraeota bacterium]